MNRLLLLYLFLALPFIPHAQPNQYDSGGPLMPEQAAYDVLFYHMDLEILPDTKSIEGSIDIRAKVVQPMNRLVLDLDAALQISQITEEGQSLSFQHQDGKIWIHLDRTRQSGEIIEVAVSYAGQPRVAPNPPWEGGFTWAKTKSGAHWIATSCQTQGADLWWPNKDHVSDEPDSMSLSITVPADLYVATNGQLKSILDEGSDKKTYNWYISTPINNYNVALNIAPYEVIEDELTSVSGEPFPVLFYVLPEDLSKGKKLMVEIKEHLEFYEKYLGPYPFRRDKYGVVQTPHLGMEHQTIIAYGANFNNGSMTGGKDWGFDALHHHELGHEWWGNLVTNFDWRDMWIHEGFCSYMQALYMEELQGAKGYHNYMNNMRRFPNTQAVSPREATSARTIYRAPIYTKGAWVLHNLRYLIGKENLLLALRRMCYPSPMLESVKDGSHCRFVTTDDFKLICEEISGQDLDWFFELYLRQAKLPNLISRVGDGKISLRWETPDDMPFNMPVDVRIGEETKRVMVDQTGIEVPFKLGQKPEVDPDKWILMNVK